VKILNFPSSHLAQVIIQIHPQRTSKLGAQLSTKEEIVEWQLEEQWVGMTTTGKTGTIKFHRKSEQGGLDLAIKNGEEYFFLLLLRLHRPPLL
jgi:hypothetical protein